MKTCEKCGVKTKEIQQHHIIPRSLGGSDNEENLMSLCVKCHRAAHGVLPKDVKHTELIKAGLNRAVSKGKTLGRPTGTTQGKEETLKKYLPVAYAIMAGYSIRKAAARCGVSPNTVVKVKDLL